jgi:hypothetical protein
VKRLHKWGNKSASTPHREALPLGKVLVAVVALIFASAPPVALASSATLLRGTVTGDGKPLPGAQVTLFSGARQGSSELGRATTTSSGSFQISYVKPGTGIIYVEAVAKNTSKSRLLSVIGVTGGGGVPPQTVPAVTVNELTTVASSYALAQFRRGDRFSGPSPGLENAAATAFNLANPADGKAGAVVTDADNGSHNATLATLGTLANLLSLCSGAQPRRCDELLRLATPYGGTTPADTVEAALDLARHPRLAPLRLYLLARDAHVYEPALSHPIPAWVLALRYTEPELYASGRIALDAHGYVWSSNNWLPGSQAPSPYVTVLNPVGEAASGSPINGGGMKGGAWGAAISAADGSVWMGSFGGNALAKYSADGTPSSPSTGWSNGGLDHPQGIAIDQKGNVWIANNYGPESPPGQGDVVVYPGGDPAKAVKITGGGLNHPFAVQIDGYGRAWVTNAGPGGAKLVGTRAAVLVGKFGGSVTVIGPNFKPTSFSPIESSSFKWPLGLAIDSEGNAWVANYFSSSITEIGPKGSVAGVYKLPPGTLPWSEAVDGSDHVWVAGFGRPAVWELCGVGTNSCPKGAKAGDLLSPKHGYQSYAFQHFTSVQVDQSGNVWLSNNWSKLYPPTGGIGIAELIGVATPVCTPLQPLPVAPSSVSTTACPLQAAAVPAAVDQTGTSIWLWIGIGAAVAVLATAGGLLFRRRHAHQ